jgi:hypothetical protein
LGISGEAKIFWIGGTQHSRTSIRP